MGNLWDRLQFFRPGWLDALQILLVAALLYQVLLFLRHRRAMYVLVGLFALALVYFVARALDLILIRAILESVFQYGVIAAIVIFHPELRLGLMRLGRTRFFRLVSPPHDVAVIDEIVDAVHQLSRSKIGAIIAVQQEVELDEYAQTGTPQSAKVSAPLLVSIFSPYSPLHDGAVILVDDEIRAAGAILPLTQYALADRTLGTRHRAAIGLSEETDAVVIVVSEETARVSVAVGGRLERDVDGPRLREILGGALPEHAGARPGAALA
ncbi:MAG: TIGR00159 family protein [Gemmatimonadetes bacterium]|nr:MAG: TIGR00159 family protein [Gemmatimonadota bacterium]